MKKMFTILLLVLPCYHLISGNYIERDTNEKFISILRIDHFNDDTVKDTLIGLAETDYKFKPRFIKWGKDTLSTIPDSLLVDFTEISYPSHTWTNTSCTWTDPSRTWSDFRVSANIDRLNGDTIADLILIMWGKVEEDSVYKDTACALTIFGQRGLDTISIIYTADIDTLQSTPFFAKSFRHGTELTSGKIRDLSKIPSYKVNKIVIEGLDQEGPGNIGPNEVSDKLKPYIKIYPNPASEYTNFEISDLSPGTYSVEILSLQGKLINSQRILIESSQKFIKTLHLDNLSTGCYMLRLFSNKMIIGTYQLIVIH